ncbi:MAG: hypothetical protein IAF58_13520 [Leptolyngbya sp.]|nr:hypothetical protein [Candidatus Melainabacteria bacterium]
MMGSKRAVVTPSDIIWTVVIQDKSFEIQGLDAAMSHASNHSPDSIRLVNARKRTITLVAGHTMSAVEQLECA